MPACKNCGEIVTVFDIDEHGLCKKCSSIEVVKEIEEKNFRLQELSDNPKVLDSIFVTTETMIDIPIAERTEVIFSEYVYGMNILKDFFTSIRDVVGGRVKNIENVLQDTNKKVIIDLKEKAYLLGGDAVVGLKINYATTNMLSVIAVGTVVKFVNKDNKDNK